MSPDLFNAVLEHHFQISNWKNYGVKINEELLNNLRFADDVVLIAESQEYLLKMINDLSVKSEEIGLSINFNK